jgi:DNA-binding response OmpR family regulator
MTDSHPHVLCVEDSRDLVAVVDAILSDEGYSVSSLYDTDADTVLRAIGRLEPDAVLLDGGEGGAYGAAWAVAEEIAARERPVPVIMFTAHQIDLEEAAEATSQRAIRANFAGIVPKPFDLDELVAAVETAVGREPAFDRSEAAEAQRTDELVAALEAHGATDVKPSKMREWALFRDPQGRLLQFYWWQSRGVYQVARYRESGLLALLGQFVSRDAAIDVALPTAHG